MENTGAQAQKGLLYLFIGIIVLTIGLIFKSDTILVSTIFGSISIIYGLSILVDLKPDKYNPSEIADEKIRERIEKITQMVKADLNHNNELGVNSPEIISHNYNTVSSNSRANLDLYSKGLRAKSHSKRSEDEYIFIFEISDNEYFDEGSFKEYSQAEDLNQILTCLLKIFFQKDTNYRIRTMENQPTTNDENPVLLKYALYINIGFKHQYNLRLLELIVANAFVDTEKNWVKQFSK